MSETQCWTEQWKRTCTKDNPMPRNSSQVWEHPHSVQFGSSGHGDNGATGFFQCDICGHDFMGRSMAAADEGTVQ